MASTGKYRYPIVGTNRTALPRLNRVNLRNGIQYGKDTNSEIPLLEFFLPAESVATSVTGTASVSQKYQSVAATGTVVANVSGTASVSQQYQSASATATETMSGTVSASQKYQSAVNTATETMSGTSAVSQPAQTGSALGTETMSGTSSVTQTAQTVVAAGSETMGGSVSASQGAQSALLDGTSTAPSGSFGDAWVTQAVQFMLAMGDVSVTTAYQYEPRTNIPRVVRRKLYIKGRRRV